MRDEGRSVSSPLRSWLATFITLNVLVVYALAFAMCDTARAGT
jgi:hypothetical protein